MKVSLVVSDKQEFGTGPDDHHDRPKKGSRSARNTKPN
jgi:hypothetical protein